MNLFHDCIGKCSNPMDLTNAKAMDYVDPALEGQTITFTCPHGQILNGSSSSTCIGNGEWEPDLQEIKCTGKSLSVSAINFVASMRVLFVYHVYYYRYTNNYHHPTADVDGCSLYASGCLF